MEEENQEEGQLWATLREEKQRENKNTNTNKTEQIHTRDQLRWNKMMINLLGGGMRGGAVLTLGGGGRKGGGGMFGGRGPGGKKVGILAGAGSASDCSAITCTTTQHTHSALLL